MGIFSKDRHGTIECPVLGRQFIWTIPSISSYVDTVLSSDNVRSFNSAEFSLRLTISRSCNVGFYIHYKDEEIPKFSYYFSVPLQEPAPTDQIWIPPPGVDPLRKSRQFTAHSIPPEVVERCGHYNVLNGDQFRTLVNGVNTLVVVFEFDQDRITAEDHGKGDAKIRWTIPRFRYRQCQPFTSRGFIHKDVLYVLRLDQLEATKDYIVFVQSPTHSAPPPHTLRVTTSGGELLAQTGHALSADTSAQDMILSHDTMSKVILLNTSIITEAVVMGASNPLNKFSLPTSHLASGMPEERPEEGHTPTVVNVGSSEYWVLPIDV